MQIRNNYDKEVYNGDLGTIVSLDLVDQRVVGHFAFALDLGVQYELQPDLWIGGAVTNLGQGVTFITEQDDLPTAVQVGGSYRLPQRIGNGSLLVAADVRQTRGDDAHLLVGG